MPIHLEGSCHCKKVTFAFDSNTPQPFMVCYCQTDTKTAGFGTRNIMGIAKTLTLGGTEPAAKRIYQATREDGSVSKHERHFCSNCGSFLYAYDQTYPENIYPFSTSIDTILPDVQDKDLIHIFLSSKLQQTPHIPLESTQRFQEYPIGMAGIEAWHKLNNKWID